MKKRNKILSLLLITVLFTSCLTGCGGKTTNSNEEGAKGNTATDIQISVWNAGLGVDWVEALIEGFEKKHPEYNVTYTGSASLTAVSATFGMPDVDTTDLYMTFVETDTTYLEPLDDVLAATADGEQKAIGEKFNPGYLELAVAKDGHYYTLTSGGGVLNFVYNKELFEEAGISQLPRTTDELTVVCDTLYSAGITPLCHYANGGYYAFLDQVFMAQYDGIDYVKNNFYACTDENGTSPSKEVFLKQDGRYYALKAYEKFVTPEYTMVGSNSKSHTEIQTEFLQGKAAMMYNGSWMENEMKAYETGGKFVQFKTPVLSAIINKLTTIKSDGELRRVITAIDQVTDGEKKLEDFASGDNYVIGNLTVSAKDWDAVYTARNIAATNFSGECAFIPSYSQAKEGAKEFLKYMYSDEGYQIRVDELHLPLPLSLSTGEKVDTSKFSEFEKFQFETVDAAKYFSSEYIYSRHEIFTAGGAQYFGGLAFISKLCTNNSADRMTADELWKEYLDLVEDNYEASWLKNIK